MRKIIVFTLFIFNIYSLVNAMDSVYIIPNGVGGNGFKVGDEKIDVSTVSAFLYISSGAISASSITVNGANVLVSGINGVTSNSTQTWTALQTFNNLVTISTSLIVTNNGNIIASSGTFTGTTSHSNLVSVSSTIIINGNGNLIASSATFSNQVSIFNSSPHYGVDISTFVRATGDIYMQNAPSMVYLIWRNTTYGNLPGTFTTWNNSDVPLMPAMIRADGACQYRLTISASGATTANYDIQVVDASNANALVVQYNNIAASTNVDGGWTAYNGGNATSVHDLILQIKQDSGTGGTAGVNAIFLNVKGQN